MAINTVPYTISRFNCFLDGRVYAGICSEVELPKLTMKFEERNIGDMSYPIENGMEKMEASLTFMEWQPEVIKTFGVRISGPISFVLRATAKKDVAQAIEVQLRGYVSSLDMGSLKAGEAQGELKISLQCTYYQYSHNGATLIEIDPANFVRMIGGIDQLAQERAILLR